MNARGNHYQRVIESALGSIKKAGSIPVSIRELIETTGLDEEQVKACFPSIDSLHAGLIDHCVVLLSNALVESVVHADPDDPKEQIRALSMAFFTWGEKNPILFALLGKALIDPDFAPYTLLDMHRQAIRDLVRRKLEECKTRGLIDRDVDLDLFMAVANSSVLGISSMLIYGRADAWYDGGIRDLGELSKRMSNFLLDQLIRSPSLVSRQKVKAASL